MTADIVARRFRLGEDLAGDGTILSSSLTREVGKHFNDAGAGSLELLNTSGDLAGFELDGDDLIAIDLQETRIATFVVEKPKKHVVTQSAGNRRTALPGRTHHALLERFVVMPNGGPGHLPKQIDRWWDWTAPEFDDSAWNDAYDVGYVAVAQLYWPIPWAGDMPSGYPGPDPVQIIWAPSAAAWAGDTSGSPGGNVALWAYAYAPATDVYFRLAFLDTRPQGTRLRYLTADNTVTDYINGVHLGAAGATGDPGSSGYTSADVERIVYTPGTQLYAAVASNFPPNGGPNPAGLAVLMVIPGFPPAEIFHSAADGWKVLEAADPPGMTMGKKWNILFDEMQAEGFLPFFTRGWTDTHDFAGNLWPVVNASSRVGTDYLTELRQDASTYLDWDMPSDSYELRLWVKGQKNTTPGTELLVNENLTDLSHELDAWRADSLLVDYQGGWELREVGSPSRRALLALGSDADLGEVDRKTDGELALFSSARRLVDLTYAPRFPEEWPGVGFDTGDVITVTDDDGTGTIDVVVQAWTVLDSGKTGRALATITVGDEGAFPE